MRALQFGHDLRVLCLLFLHGDISKSTLDESEMYDSVENIEPFFMSIDISQEVEKWGAKAEVKSLMQKNKTFS